MTYLEIVNSVLRRLRENEVLSVSDGDYSMLIGDFVNQAKREIEDSWDWTHLRTVIPVTTSSGVGSNVITGAGDRYRIISVYNYTEESEMFKVNQGFIDREANLGTTQLEAPIYYNIKGQSGGDPVVYFWPIPNGTYTINFNIKVPQASLSNDTDELTIPSWPVILGAYAKAVSERGEDGGFAYAEAISEYSRTLSDAISFDSLNTSGELDWRVE